MKINRTAVFTVLALALAIGLMSFGPTSTSAAGPWYVDAATGSDSNDCFTPGTACLTIQGAVNKASGGDTINVAAGTYTENVLIAKSLTLLGAQAGTDARGRSATESIVIPAIAGSPAFNITLNGTLRIDGFSFTGGTALGLIMTGTLGPTDDMQIVNNRFSGYSGAAIYMNRGGTNITINQNVMDGSNIASSGQAIYASNTQSFLGLNITNNWIINNKGRYGIFSDGDHNLKQSATRQALIDGNLIDNNLQGMNLGSRSFGSLALPPSPFPYAGTISNNVITNNVFDGVQGGVQYVLITSNKISNNGRNGIGLSNIGSAGADRGAQNSTVRCNLLINNGFAPMPNNGSGIFLSAGQPAGTQATNVIILNNIQSNAVGLTYLGIEVIRASNNWWGSATGPTHANNPGGTGDSVVNPSGSVDYIPFLVATSPCAPLPDSDGDGIGDDVDNCPSTPNADQANYDGDSLGDACDPNDDNDSQTDADEIACGSDPMNELSTSPDADNDGIPDCIETDDDNDTIPDTTDNCPLTPNTDQEDFDGNGVGDACEPAPRLIKQDVLNQLIALRAGVTDKQDGDRLDDAIKHLTKSVNANLWIDDAHPKPKEGDKVFNEEKAAVAKLKEIVKDNNNTVPDATIQMYINRIVGADRSIAKIAIDDAIARTGNAGKIAMANNELTKGDTDFGNDKPKEAIDHYHKAWEAAIKA